MYRGKLVSHPEHLNDALKIIIHISCAYTKRHRQRTILPLAVPAPPPRAAAAPAPPAPPAVDTGMTFQDLRVGMRVQVWWLDDWWTARIKYVNPRTERIAVIFLGDSACTTGILPKHIKIAADR